MKRHFGIIVTGVLVVLVLLGLNLAGTVNFDEPREDEIESIRSTFNSGPTGLRAFYQLLEESRYPVERWRQNFRELNRPASGSASSVLVMVGPFLSQDAIEKEEAKELQQWVSSGGRLLVVSRSPSLQFPDSRLLAAGKSVSPPLRTTRPEELVDPDSAVLISQPTELTRGLRDLRISKLASRISIKSESEEIQAEQNQDKNGNAAPSPTPSPVDSEEDEGLRVSSPVVHLGDAEGAVLVSCSYGKGEVIFLSDPFPISNNGISQGANLTLALNLVDYLGGGSSKILFDEFHHGYESRGNAVFSYFRGTPLVAGLMQVLLLAGVVVYSQGKRFARPLPMPVQDRHSPLEFVGSMASLQKSAQARDLALENIYPRFRSRICRSLGLAVTAPADTIVASLRRRGRVKSSEMELLRIFSESEKALAGNRLDDHTLVRLISSMREISARIK